MWWNGMTHKWLIMTFKWLMNDLFKMKWLINSFKLKLFLLHNIDIDYARPQLPAWKAGLFQVCSFWDMIMSLEARQTTFEFWECSAVRRNYDTSLINCVNFTLDWWEKGKSGKFGRKTKQELWLKSQVPLDTKSPVQSKSVPWKFPHGTLS